MAGIGFPLKKVTKDNSFLEGIRSFTFSSLLIAGPMVLCVLLILVAQHFLKMMGAPLQERQLFLGGAMYSFVFSQLITGGFIMAVTRYVADQLYANKRDNILSSLYGVLAVVIFAGGGIGMLFYAFSPLDFTFKLAAYLFFMELLIIWLLSMYLSALKNYGRILVGFLTGVCVSFLAIVFCYTVLNTVTASWLFFCMDLGFFLTILFFFDSIREHFSVNNQRYFDLLIYLEKYPALFLIGLLYTVGLYGHSFIVWGSELQLVIGGTFIMAPQYDVPIFYAYLTILPALIQFVISMETKFYDRYKALYGRISGPSSLRDITDAQSKMFGVLSRELVFIMEFQLLFTVCAIALGASLLPLSAEQIDIFNIVTIGNYFFIMMFIIMQILLYFDDRKGALFVIFSYAAASLLFTWLSVVTGSYGLSCFISGFIGLILSLGRLLYYHKNFGYYTYCSQPLFARREEWAVEPAIKKLAVWNGTETKAHK